MKRLIAFWLCIMLLCLSALPVYANSAPEYWTGVDASGVMIADEECPLVVEKEVLTFDVQQFPQYSYTSQGDFNAYTPKVTAEYTFYNPSDYTVTATLLFPFGNMPSYAEGYTDTSERYLAFDDTQKYHITVNGKPISNEIRHTLSYPGEVFDLQKDLSRMRDGYALDAFYYPALPVTKYTFQVSNVEKDKYHAACMAMDVPEGVKDYRFYFPSQRGVHTQENGDMRISTWVDTDVFEMYILGTPPQTMPRWTFYRDGGVEDGEEIAGDIQLLSAEETPFEAFALSFRDEGYPASDVDWYNAVFSELKRGRENTPRHPVILCRELESAFSQNLLRWYRYEITLAPGERLVNSVTAPIYPAINDGYEPDVYFYTYLLSPAKEWKSFGELEIVIQTPYYVTDSSITGFAKTDAGYCAKLDGLPEGELEFALSTAETPEIKNNSPYLLYIAQMIKAMLQRAWILVCVVIEVLVLIILLIVVIVRKRRKKKNK